MVHIFYPKRTHTGGYVSLYGRKLNVHKHKKMGGDLLLYPSHGSNLVPLNMSGNGVSVQSEKLDVKQKIPNANLIDKLQNFSLQKPIKKKNITFIV